MTTATANITRKSALEVLKELNEQVLKANQGKIQDVVKVAMGNHLRLLCSEEVDGVATFVINKTAQKVEIPVVNLKLQAGQLYWATHYPKTDTVVVVARVINRQNIPVIARVMMRANAINMLNRHKPEVEFIHPNKVVEIIFDAFEWVNDHSAKVEEFPVYTDKTDPEFLVKTGLGKLMKVEVKSADQPAVAPATPVPSTPAVRINPAHVLAAEYKAKALKILARMYSGDALDLVSTLFDGAKLVRDNDGEYRWYRSTFYNIIEATDDTMVTLPSCLYIGTEDKSKIRIQGEVSTKVTNFALHFTAVLILRNAIEFLSHPYANLSKFDREKAVYNGLAEALQYGGTKRADLKAKIALFKDDMCKTVFGDAPATTIERTPEPTVLASPANAPADEARDVAGKPTVEQLLQKYTPRQLSDDEKWTIEEYNGKRFRRFIPKRGVKKVEPRPNQRKVAGHWYDIDKSDKFIVPNGTTEFDFLTKLHELDDTVLNRSELEIIGIQVTTTKAGNKKKKVQKDGSQQTQPTGTVTTTPTHKAKTIKPSDWMEGLVYAGVFHKDGFDTDFFHDKGEWYERPDKQMEFVRLDDLKSILQSAWEICRDAGLFGTSEIEEANGKPVEEEAKATPKDEAPAASTAANPADEAGKTVEVEVEIEAEPSDEAPISDPLRVINGNGDPVIVKDGNMFVVMHNLLVPADEAGNPNLPEGKKWVLRAIELGAMDDESKLRTQEFRKKAGRRSYDMVISDFKEAVADMQPIEAVTAA